MHRASPLLSNECGRVNETNDRIDPVDFYPTARRQKFIQPRRWGWIVSRTQFSLYKRRGTRINFGGEEGEEGDNDDSIPRDVQIVDKFRFRDNPAEWIESWMCLGIYLCLVWPGRYVMEFRKFSGTMERRLSYKCLVTRITD